jgi:hypothetical protein
MHLFISCGSGNITEESLLKNERTLVSLEEFMNLEAEQKIRIIEADKMAFQSWSDEDLIEAAIGLNGPGRIEIWSILTRRCSSSQETAKLLKEQCLLRESSDEIVAIHGSLPSSLPGYSDFTKNLIDRKEAVLTEDGALTLLLRLSNVTGVDYAKRFGLHGKQNGNVFLAAQKIGNLAGPR